MAIVEWFHEFGAGRGTSRSAALALFRPREPILNGVDPQAYIADVLTKLVDLWPEARIDELMPWAWGRARHGAEPIAA